VKIPILTLAGVDGSRLLARIAHAAEAIRDSDVPLAVACDIAWKEAAEEIVDAAAKGETEEAQQEIACRAATLVTVIKLVYSLDNKRN
jgi:hypothetical protein